MIKRALFLSALVALLALFAAAPASAKLLYVGDKGVAKVGKVPCKGRPGCKLAAPKRVQAKIGQKSFWAKVLAPKRIGPGKKAKVRVKLGAGALGELAGRTTTIRVKAVVRQDGKARKRVLRVRLRRAALAGQPGGPGGPPTSGPLGNEPPLLARPATAVDVSAVELTWYPRDSWVRYVHTGEGMFFANGATGISSSESPCPDSPSPNVQPYTVLFTPKASWFDAPSGTAGIYGQGNVDFRYSAHGINFSTSEPEVEINGAASRLIFRLSGTESTAMTSQRVSFLDLSLGSQPTVSGNTHSYELMRGTLADDGTNVFADFYPPKAAFGCVSVSFTTP